MTQVSYKGYEINFISTPTGWKYSISKGNEKLITESKQEFPFPPEAEVEAKLHINRIVASKDGWTVY